MLSASCHEQALHENEEMHGVAHTLTISQIPRHFPL